jgi:putative transposase
MKAGQFTNEQIVSILQEAQRGDKPVLALCKDKGISEATFYAWRKKFGGMNTRDVQRLKDLEKENARLKKLLAERVLENDVLKEALSKNWGALPRKESSSPGHSSVVSRSGARADWCGLPARQHATDRGLPDLTK